MNLLKIEIESLTNEKIQKLLKEIYFEVDRIRQGKYRVSFEDVINYIYGRGDWDFNVRDENGLRREEILCKVSREEVNKAIEWCRQKLRFTRALEELVEKLKHIRITSGEGLLSFIIEDVEEGLNEVWAADIIHYIACEGLIEKNRIFADIMKWCYERISKDEALIFCKFSKGGVNNAIEPYHQKLRFTRALEELVELLKHLSITREEDHFIIEDIEDNDLNEVWAADIITYILCKGLNKKEDVYDEIINWCHERISKDEALIFHPDDKNE